MLSLPFGCSSQRAHDARVDVVDIAIAIDKAYSKANCQTDEKQEEKKHKEECLAQLIEMHGYGTLSGILRRCYGVARQMLECWQDVDDAIADVCLALVSRLDSFVKNGLEHISFWLMRVTRNKCVNIIRDAQRRARLQEKLRLEMERLARVKSEADLYLQSDMWEALDSLKDSDRQLLVLRFFEPLSYSELGAIFQLTQNALYLRLHRALANLREKLEKIQSASNPKPNLSSSNSRLT